MTDPVTPRTDTEEKLWQALLDNPGSPAGFLSTAAGIGKSTAPKILNRWEKDGLVSRIAGTADGGSRPADRWSITADDESGGVESDGEQSAAVEPTGVESGGVENGDDEPDGKQPINVETAVSEGRRTTEERLAPGALRGMVEDHLREHPGEEFSPSAIGKALNRSSGAVHNALEKLVDNGCAMRTSDKPKRYSLAAAEREDATVK
ncbi:MarR family transcriptional regulator [Actinokineospora spheciospongiae]|uniref:MarR family transcriptional regulator n=1 Tax=Actinokineospora spheciospongiae TaxID=909613 RepID=UPI0011B381F9|nr:MarR family transcriptional regulator [Actinokineospora spheciospongiae]